MFHRLIADIKTGANSALKVAALLAVAAAPIGATIAFLCAAAFIAVLQSYGPVQACLTVAGIFLAIALLAIVIYAVATRRSAAAVKAPQQPRSPAGPSMLADPMLLTAGLQIVRAVGLKKLIPLLAMGGLAAGFLMNRRSSDQPTDDDSV